MEKSEKTRKSTIINSVIGVCIMFFFQFLPISLPNVTQVGMQVIGIFLGTLYLWTTVDNMWSSLLCIAALGLSGYATMNEILVDMLGNSTLMLMLFIMILSGALVKFGITDRLARFFITRKVTQGRPWLLMFMIGMGCLLMAAFVNAFAPIFIFWPILKSILNEVGCTKEEKMPKIMIMLVIVATLLGFPVPPYMDNGLICIGNFTTVTENVMGQAYYINSAAYLVNALLMAILIWVIVLLFCKFVLRPDCSKLKAFDNTKLAEEPLPPMDVQQKIICVGFVCLILFMLVPSVVQADHGVFSFLSGITYGMPLLCAVILAAIPYRNKPVMNIQEVISTEFNWTILFLCAAAILLSSALTADSTGVSDFLSSVIVPIFDGMGLIPFMILTVLLCGLLTSLCNSLVVALVFEGIIANVCVVNGFDPIPVVTIAILTSLTTAMLTPAASPFAAILHSEKTWLKRGELYKYTAIFTILELACFALIGVPLTNLITGLF